MSKAVSFEDTKTSKKTPREGGKAKEKADKEKEKHREKDGGSDDDGSEEEENETLKVIQDLAKRLREGRRRTGAKIDPRWDGIIRRSNEHLLFFSMIGLSVSVALSYYKWYERCWVKEQGGPCDPAFAGTGNATLSIATWSNTQEHMPVTQFFIIIGQVVVSFSTVVCIRVLSQLYDLHLTERRRAWSGLDEIDLINDDGDNKSRQTLFRQSYKFWRSSLKWNYLLELIVHLFHPIVAFETLGEGFATVYEISQSFIFLRLYLVLRVLYIRSRVFRDREEVVENTDLKGSGYEITMGSTFKIVFYKHPAKVVLSMTMAAILVFGFWMFVTERDNNESFESLWDCYWFVWVSLSTIGYGDMSAVTPTGRAIVVIIAICSLFITTVFAGIVTNLLSPTREQRLVTSYLAQKEAQTGYSNAAARVIVAAFDEKRRVRDEPKDKLWSRRSPHMYASIKKFRAMRLALRESLGAAGDPVMDSKLMDSLYDAWELNAELERQWKDINEVEEALAQAVAWAKISVKEASLRT